MKSPSNRPLAPRPPSISEKANRILNWVLLLFLLIAFRCWHLSVLQYETRLEQARRPQRREVTERAERGSIRDRFNLPLASNSIQYNAAIFYAHIKDIPSVAWVRNTQGEKEKHYPRRAHIQGLSELLARELRMEAERIEDLIHSKAALFPNTPFVIKEDLSEKEYFRLKALEKDWIGLYGEHAPKRSYPQNFTASHIIGYMGAISREEYLAIAEEMASIQEYFKAWEAGLEPPLPEGFSSYSALVHRHQELLQKAYTLNDSVGKTGIEAQFDSQLRGYYGKRSYQADARGNFLRELPGSQKPLPGQQVQLSLSLELQHFAEELLIQNEQIRDGRSITFDAKRHQQLSLKQPWIKGGAIVVMEPHTGEILALASYPRFNPNDFVLSDNPQKRRKQIANIHNWLESESLIEAIWDGQRPLSRERYDELKKTAVQESRELTWEHYLDLILPKSNAARQGMKKITTLGQAIALQESFETLLHLSQQADPHDLINTLFSGPGHLAYRDRLDAAKKSALKNRLLEQAQVFPMHLALLEEAFAKVPDNYDKLLMLDLCRLAVYRDPLPNELATALGAIRLEEHKKNSAAFASTLSVIRSMAKELFRDLIFSEWRLEQQKDFLKEKRAEERAAKKYARPYLDYLDAKERELFNEMWETYQLPLLSSFLTGNPQLSDAAPVELPSFLLPFIEHFQAWEKELSQGAHAHVEWFSHYQQLKKMLSRCPERALLSYLKTLRSYEDLKRPLYGKYRALRQEKGVSLEKDLAAAFYPVYGFGFARSQAYRQATPQGSIFKLVVAYEALLQRYQQLQSSHESLEDLNPLTLIDRVEKLPGAKGGWIVGYDRQGEAIPQFYKGGRLPRSDRRNNGRLNLAKAIEVSSNPYFSLLAGDVLQSPLDLNQAASHFSYGARTGIELDGEIRGQLPGDLERNRTGLYAYAIGQHSLVATPLQTAVMLSALGNGGKVFQPKIVQSLIGKKPLREEALVLLKDRYNFKEALARVGISFPLFTASESQPQARLLDETPVRLARELPMPTAIQDLLFEGMHSVLAGSDGSARPSSLRNYYPYPHLLQDYQDLAPQILGKTSTAEIVEHVDLDREMGSHIYKHIWFAGIAFDPDDPLNDLQSPKLSERFQRPELVVVVYLRFGDYGREAAPLVAQMVKKWREIKKNHAQEE